MPCTGLTRASHGPQVLALAEEEKRLVKSVASCQLEQRSAYQELDQLVHSNRPTPTPSRVTPMGGRPPQPAGPRPTTAA